MGEKFKDELEEIYTSGFKSEVNRIRDEIKVQARNAAKTQTYLNTKIDTNEFTSKAAISSILLWLKGEGFENSHVKLICEDNSHIVKLHIGIEW